MSLAAGPGRGHTTAGQLPDEVKLVVDKHVAYIQTLDTRRDELAYHLTAHLRIGGLYWGLTALHLLHHPSALPRQDVIAFVLQCLRPSHDGDSAGFGAAPGHNAHMLYTGYSIQILFTLDAFPSLEASLGPDAKRKIASFIAALQQRSSGVFAGDEWGETDTRFTFIALYTLSLLGYLPAQRPADEEPLIDVERAVAYIAACQNADGAFGVHPGAESHSGQVYTCLGALALTDSLDTVLGGESGKDRLAAWLSERQLPSGGLNGRPEKLVDVCYSWWVMSSLAMLGRLHWIDKARLAGFILGCQDPEGGGFADREGDAVDVFHTVFGLAGLSLVGWEGLGEVDEVYCMPKSVTAKILKAYTAE